MYLIIAALAAPTAPHGLYCTTFTEGGENYGCAHKSKKQTIQAFHDNLIFVFKKEIVNAFI
ncbi:hypothetical protein [Mucilaginibacter sp. OK098]|uniref:hypothetical protein n=1 Tax=Mucilaginibacter sp. OK098 TaxID=1855297 RepID=UPI00090EDD78|nr:hypothetical protein [Mucilaginibacter sp. OK098]SHN35522.1 hypothetical protein SAMN05216524_11253 [Mucilaginibacter sp. OK098]